MGWIQNLFGRRKALTLRDLGGFFSTGHWNNTAMLDQYGKSVYVFAAINKIAQKIASLELQLFQIKNSKGDVDEVPSHPSLDLLYRCNPFQTKNEFWKITLINKKLTGEAFWLKIRDNRGQVVELWNLRPDLVTVVSDPQKYVKHYEFDKGDGKKEIFPPEDIIHLKDPNPLDPFRGLSPLKAAQSRVETEIHATDFQRQFFLNNARPDALLLSDDNLAPEQRDELKSSWNAKHQGVARSSRLGILEGGITYQQIAISQKEMDYINSLNFTRDDILVAFGVPKSIVTTDDVNYANANQGLKSFLSETIIPEMEGIVETLNEMLIIPDFGERFYLDFIDPTPADRQMELNEHTAGVDKWITRNEIRKKLNLEPQDGGDVLYLPLGVQPMNVSLDEEEEEDDFETEKIFKGRHALRLKLQLEEKIANDIKSALKSKKKATTLLKDKAIRKFYEGTVNKKIDQRAAKFRTAVEKESTRQMNRVLDTLKKDIQPGHTKAVSDLINFDKAKENKIFAKLALPFLLDSAVDAGQDALDMIGGGEFSLTEQLQKALAKRAKFFAKSINDTTLDKLTNTLAQGIAGGEGINELSERITEVYDQFPTYRSDQIARTEATAANNEGFLEAYKQSPVVNSMEWIATSDDRTRDSHLAQDGEIVKVGETFSNGLRYPGDNRGDASETVNCRCTIAPVV